MIMHRRMARQRNLVPSVSYSIGVSVDTANQSIIQGSQVTYNYTLVRYGGYTGTVNISVSGLPSGVSGSFTNSTLSGATLTTTLTLTATAGATLITDKAISVTVSGSGVSDVVINDTLDVITTPSGTINAVAYRYDGNSGLGMVSHAWPCVPGAIYPADLTKFVIRDGGTELALAARAGTSLFPDGSCRTVEYQVKVTLTNLTSKALTVEVGGTTRNTAADLVYVEQPYNDASILNPAWTHKAFIIPAESQYWCNTMVALVPLMPEENEVADSASTFFRTATGTTSTLGEWTAYYDANYAPTGQAAGATYDHMHGFLCAAIRSANTTATSIAYYKRFLDASAKLLLEYLSVNNPSADSPGGNVIARVGNGKDATLPNGTSSGLTAEQHSNFAYSIGCFYLCTGWAQPWRHLAMLSSWTFRNTSYAAARDYNVQSDTMPRFNTSQQMSFKAMAYIIGATMQVGNGSFGYGSGRDNNTASWSQDLTWHIDSLIDNIYSGYSTGYADGLVGCKQTVTDNGALPAAGRAPNFQNFVTARYLILHYEHIYPDTRIPALIKFIADFAISQFRDESILYSLPYCHDPNPDSVVYDGTEHTGGSGTPIGNKRDPYYAPMFSEVFSWVYGNTGNTLYRTWALRCTNARELNNPSIFIATPKAFGEYFSGTQQSSKYRIDTGLNRINSAAHPTTFLSKPTVSR